MIEVEILGETYTLKTETGAEYTKRVAEHVDRTAREIREDAGMMDHKKVAILTAIAVTDQLFRMRDGVDTVRGLAERRAERLIGEILATVEQSAGN